MDDLKATWEKEASRWAAQAEDPQNKYTRFVHLVADVLRRHVRHGKALDIGCGPGLLCNRLLEIGLDPYGTDIAENMIQAAVGRFTGKVADPKDRFRLCRAGEIPFEGMKFDLITAIQVFPYIEQHRASIRKLATMLAPSGIIAATNTNRFSLWVMHELANRAFRLPPHLRTIRNLARTGYHSGGHVNYWKAQQAYSAKRFDALFAEEGFELIDAMDFYQIRRLDGDPLNRQGLRRFLARHLAWYHLGVYAKTDTKLKSAKTDGATTERPCIS